MFKLRRGLRRYRSVENTINVMNRLEFTMPICRSGQTVIMENGAKITRKEYEKNHGEKVKGYETAFDDLPECDLENKEVISPEPSDLPEP
jgi:hypothetical protein